MFISVNQRPKKKVTDFSDKLLEKLGFLSAHACGLLEKNPISGLVVTSHHYFKKMSKETAVTHPTSITRRRFLTLVTHGGWLAAMGILVYQTGRFLGTRGVAATPSPVVVAGPLKDFPLETTTYVPEAQTWVSNDNGELEALDAVCPHLGCLVRQKETPHTGFHCSCHGSEFGTDGELERGPAKRPLRPLNIQTTPDNTVLIRT